LIKILNREIENMALCFGGDWKESIKDDHPLCFGGDWWESLEDYENKEETTEKETTEKETTEKETTEKETTEKFIQGEWVVERIDIDGDGCLHFTVLGIPRVNGSIHMDCETLQSTAALIATAPRVYALLKRMIEPTFKSAIISQELKMEIESVLKKARGDLRE
jgi:hypothetical protein